MSMNGTEFGQGGVRSPAGQVLPTVDPDGQSRAVRDTPESNRSTAAIVGLVLGLIPILSVIGLIVSVVALRGYRKVGQRGTLAVIGIAMSAVVLVGSVVVFTTNALG